MLNKIISLLFAIGLVATDVSAQPRNQIVCNFIGGVARDLDGRQTQNEIVSDRLTLIFQSMNDSLGTAEMIGNNGIPGPVTMINGTQALSFVEETPLGSVTTTTIFPQQGQRSVPAVHSRHMQIPSGTPFVSQYYGTCFVN